jgi:hypothetical protein
MALVFLRFLKMRVFFPNAEAVKKVMKDISVAIFEKDPLHHIFQDYFKVTLWKKVFLLSLFDHFLIINL